MHPPAPPDLDATLAELATLGMRAVRAVTRVMEIEQAAADALATCLPNPANAPASLEQAIDAGRDIDNVAAVLATAVPRIETLARAHDRLSRAVRRSVALRRRLQTGWPRANPADDRAAMVRRQVTRRVGDAIRSEAAGEAAERLFDDLAERLDDPALADELQTLPVEEIVRRICRDLGIPEPPSSSERASGPPAATPTHPPDTG